MSLKHLALFSLFSIGCSNPASAPDLGGDAGGDGPLDASVSVPDDLAPATVSGTFTFTLDAGAFPPTAAHPSALVYLPSGFHPTRPLDLIVYLHGNSNCIENIIRDAGQECTPGAGVRDAYSLAAQLEASGKNALFLAPEVVYDAADSSPGNLGKAGGFQALLGELLLDLQPVIGTFGLADVGHVLVLTHSGGYLAAAGIANVGGVPVDELCLLDSLYGATTPFETWVTNNLPQLAGSPPPHRFADVYLTGGSTAVDSTTMANDVAKLIPADAGILIDDRTTATWPDSMYLHGVLFKASSLAHNDIPRYYFGKLVESSGLRAK